LSEAWNDLDWVPDTWWRLVTGEVKRQPVERVHRRFLELCVFTQMMWDLKSGDTAIEGSREYADYRDQLISEDEAAKMTAAYEQEAGISSDAQRFVSERRQWLTSITQQTDRSSPENVALRIENGEPVLTKLLTPGPTIGLEDVQNATTLAIRKLDESFFRVRFDRLTPREKDYLRAMARLGSGHQRSGEIAESAGLTVQTVAPVRNSLIKKGMIYSPAHGDTAFTVPLFGSFLLRVMPSTPSRT